MSHNSSSLWVRTKWKEYVQRYTYKFALYPWNVFIWIDLVRKTNHQNSIVKGDFEPLMVQLISGMICPNSYKPVEENKNRRICMHSLSIYPRDFSVDNIGCRKVKMQN